MDLTRQHAAEMLAEADRAASAVERRTPKEHLPFFGWGLFNALVIPGFDFIDGTVWGWVTISLAGAGFAATFAYFAVRSLQVEVKQRSPWWTWPVLNVWMALAGMLAWALEDRFPLAYTVAGLLAGIPFLAWGRHLLREGR